jgi:hypothetical protein
MQKGQKLKGKEVYWNARPDCTCTGSVYTKPMQICHVASATAVFKASICFNCHLPKLGNMSLHNSYAVIPD